MSDFKREERYLVIPIKHLSTSHELSIRRELEEQKIKLVECVVVEADWPNYEHTWNTIKQVTEGKWEEPGNITKTGY